MSEYVYKLDLPSLPEILLDNVHDEIFSEIPYLKSGSVWRHLKPEWYTLNEIRWTIWSIFYRDIKLNNESQSFIHSDTPINSESNALCWAINFIWNGYGEMNYWLPDNLTMFKLSYDTKNIDIIGYNNPMNVSPIKSYHLEPGAYLVNIELPHKAYGYNKRYNFSLRSHEKQAINMLWPDAVNHFSNLIIPWD